MNWKKKSLLVLSLSLLMGIGINSVSAKDDIKVVLNESELSFDVSPQIINDRTMVPMRKIFEELGATVKWDDGTITATKDDVIIVMKIDNDTMNVNNKEIKLDTAPQLISDTTLVPVRAIAEGLGSEVSWDADSNTVIIVDKNELSAIDKAIEAIYQYENPTLDFSNDNGTGFYMHLQVRNMFEQYKLPEVLFSEDKMADYIVNDPAKVLEFVDNTAWTKCKDTVIIKYLTESDEEYKISSLDEITNIIDEKTKEFKLHAYTSYEADAVKLDNDTYCIILNMAELPEKYAKDPIDTMTISSYIAITYNKELGIQYYLLEKSLDNTYMLCSIDKDGTHSIVLGLNDNNKRTFVEAVKSIVVK